LLFEKIKEIAMLRNHLTRRRFLAGATTTALAACGDSAFDADADAAAGTAKTVERGSQRLSLEQLKKWESLQYGMFIHYGMATFVQNEFPSGKEPATTYAPDRLDVDQWVSIARDAGMKYIVLTTKHVAGHCLWPSRFTDYSVANSADKTNVVEQFCKSCEKRGVLPGLYYNSSDNHDRFGSMMLFDEGHGPWGKMSDIPKPHDRLPPFTTSLYQSFMTAQITELLTQFGPIAEMWIDMPGILGRGYRTFLYQEMARLQPQTAVMMNSDGAAKFNVAYAWPSDLISLERALPPGGGYAKWRNIEGNNCYMPGEVCDPIGKNWFWVSGDKPRSDESLLKQFNACRTGGVNLLLDVPADKRGLIPEESAAALMRLRKNANI
jgi:alpha-L-fucosidase